MISASHNPMPDNGIKLFSRGGHKLPDAVEAAIEHTVTTARRRTDGHRPTGAGIGRVRDVTDGAARYAEHLLSTVAQPLAGVTVVVDCAHGAASTAAPEVYRRAGATVHVIGGEPDGWNINDGIGSTHLGPLTEAVRATGADLGIAHDGDADRCLAVSATGDPVDGDAILAVCALGLKERGELREDTVVATVMSNLGFHHTMRRAGIAVQTTAVGDRYVLEALRRGGLSLGGEQSGHLVFLDHATTGDGLLTGLALMDRMQVTGSPLADLTAQVEKLPQVLVNVPVRDRIAVVESTSVADAVERRRGRARRLRPGAAPPLGHRAARPCHGRGPHPGPGRRRRRPPREGRRGGRLTDPAGVPRRAGPPRPSGTRPGRSAAGTLG